MTGVVCGSIRLALTVGIAASALITAGAELADDEGGVAIMVVAD